MAVISLSHHDISPMLKTWSELGGWYKSLYTPRVYAPGLTQYCCPSAHYIVRSKLIKTSEKVRFQAFSKRSKVWYMASPSPKLGFTPYLAIISYLIKQRTSNFANTFRASIRTKTHQKIFEIRSVGVSRDFTVLWGTPYYHRTGKSYGFQIWPIHSWGPYD